MTAPRAVTDVTRLRVESMDGTIHYSNTEVQPRDWGSWCGLRFWACVGVPRETVKLTRFRDGDVVVTCLTCLGDR